MLFSAFQKKKIFILNLVGFTIRNSSYLSFGAPEVSDLQLVMTVVYLYLYLVLVEVPSPGSLLY
uniref:Putative ovule protein n=1 Tax=Solanum chacoense TaxID=4108 RepID=A0A0V0GR29_SOLCH